jgi:hypothetical protein
MQLRDGRDLRGPPAVVSVQSLEERRWRLRILHARVAKDGVFAA